MIVSFPHVPITPVQVLDSGYRLTEGHLGQRAVPENRAENSSSPNPHGLPFVILRKPLMAVHILQNMHALFCKYKSNQIHNIKHDC